MSNPQSASYVSTKVSQPTPLAKEVYTLVLDHFIDKEVRRGDAMNAVGDSLAYLFSTLTPEEQYKDLVDGEPLLTIVTDANLEVTVRVNRTNKPLPSLGKSQVN